MRLSTTKDRVLKSLVTYNPSIKDLKIDKHTIDAALVELAKENYITIIETSGKGSGLVRTYEPQSVLPLGAIFFKTNQSFASKDFWRRFQSFLKNYWVLIAFFIPIFMNIYQKFESEKYKKEITTLTKQLQQARDSLYDTTNRMKK